MFETLTKGFKAARNRLAGVAELTEASIDPAPPYKLLGRSCPAVLGTHSVRRSEPMAPSKRRASVRVSGH